jgi:hypothetical protein
MRAVAGFVQSQPGANLGQVSAYFEGMRALGGITEALQDPLLNQPESPHLDLGGRRGRHRREAARASPWTGAAWSFLVLFEAGTPRQNRAELDRLLAH